MLGGHLTQIALPGPADVAALVDQWVDVPDTARPRPVRRIPVDVELSELRDTRLQPGDVVVGIGGQDCEPVALDFARTGNVLLVVGPNRSGRSTTLASLLVSFLDRAPETRFRLLAPRRSGLHDLGEHRNVDVVATTPQEILGSLDGLTVTPASPLVVLVDDAEALALAGDGRFEAALRAAPETGTRFVVAARGADLQGIYDGWSRYVQSLGVALALQPGAAEAMLLGFRLPANAGLFPAGRGLLIERGRATVVQVHRTAPVADATLSASFQHRRP